VERVKQFIKELSIHELLQIQQDLRANGTYLKQLVASQLQALETTDCKTCAHCGSDIVRAQHNSFTLVFGPSDFRKKATLCGLDCMQQFTRKLEDIERRSLVQGK